METIPYRIYVLKECVRQWGECQMQDGYGPWYVQPEDVRRDYYNDMYQHIWPDRLKLDAVILPDEPEGNAWEFLQTDYISEKDGDIMKSGADIICHQTNCRGVMGAGLAKQIKLANPEIFHEYQEKCRQHGAKMLGQALILPVDSDRNKPMSEQQFIANCFGQNSYGRGTIQTDYKALKSALTLVKGFAGCRNKNNIAIPYKLGCGLAGGNWDVVTDIIRQVFVGTGFNVTIWRYEP